MREDVSSLLNDIIDKYGEWIEMSPEPELFLIEILSNLLLQTKEENKFLKKISYQTNNLSRK